MAKDNCKEVEEDDNVPSEVINKVSKTCTVANEKESKSKYEILRWHGSKKRFAFVNFAVANVLIGTPRDDYESIKQYHMTFKFVRTESKIVRKILTAHGYKEAHPHSNNFNLLWSGGHFRPYTLRGLQDFQKANHFPRSFELTRKDKLYRNVQRMQQCKGSRYFDFIPTFFVLPSERSEFHTAFLKDKGPWIVKPVASSRGRGIFLIKDSSMVPSDEQVLVCRYIENPLLVDGFKFDCRIYVAVTSFDPVTVYMYKEGLARFSTVKYEKNFNNIRNLWMHLTNYSIQKNNENYVRCDDPELDNVGSKWSFSALLRHLKGRGVDTKSLMGRIEDVIVKTILSVEFSVGTACRMFVPYKSCCFELYGFDILIDEELKPWLLECNLSPSLACESPLDLKIKANLMTDLFNLTGFIAKDPMTVKSGALRRSFSSRGLAQRYRSVSSSNADAKSSSSAGDVRKNPNEGLTNDELRMIREAKEEYKRRGKFVRIYPTPESWEVYSSLQEHSSSKNKTLHAGLFPELWSGNQRPTSAKYMARARSFSASGFKQQQEIHDIGSAHGMVFHGRYQCYEKKLDSWDQCLSDGNHVSVNDDTSAKETVGFGKYEQRLLGKQSQDKADFDLLTIIKNGDCLSKLQAREAFASYLERVQSRLLQEISASSQRHTAKSNAEEATQEEQMNLIIRFLKKAAVNFRHPMAIVTPSRALPIHEKQRMLARQLKDFVSSYRKETAHISELDKKLHKTDPSEHSIADDAFHIFISIASESELEELLSVFTRNNNAAGIFLGEADAEKRASSRPNNAQRISSASKQTSDQQVPHTTWRELLLKRDASSQPSLVKYEQPVPAVRAFGYTLSLGTKLRPVSANPQIKQGVRNIHTRKDRPATAFISSSQNISSSPQKSASQEKSQGKEHGSSIRLDSLLSTDQKLNNHTSPKKLTNHTRHSSAPSSTSFNTSSKVTTVIKNHKTGKKFIDDDAEKTFESFVNYGNSFLKDTNTDYGSLNEISRSTGTQTVEAQEHAGRSNEYFVSRESRRINANVKRAQKAYYNSYLKELQSDIKRVPHPPSQRPAFKKPVTTTRINRMMAKVKDKD